jgi:hypothetical protein
MKKPALLFFASVCFLSCDYIMKPRDTEGKTGKTVSSKNVVLGTDKDENGCVKSAGYRWSVIKEECIRPVDEGYRLNTIQQLASESDVTSVYVLFEENGDNAELFLPGSVKSILLKRDGKGNPYKDKNWILYSQNGYKLKKNGILLYAGAVAVQEGQITGDDQQEQD